MNSYLKEFLKRGFMFSGLGPVTAGIVCFFVSLVEKGFSLTGTQFMIAVISTYFLAFIQAGVTVFNQIEHWSVPRALACHFSFLYVTYLICYLVNSWIPFNTTVVLIFTLIFSFTFFIIWISVFFTVRTLSRRLNKKLEKTV